MFQANLSTTIATLFLGITTAANPALDDMQRGTKYFAPATIERASYINWVTPILEPQNSKSAFTDYAFDWFETEKDRPLPSQVYQDRDKIFVRVDRPLQETNDLESRGEIEEGTTVGAEVYAEMDGAPSEVLTAMLFRWGKPAKAEEGTTAPSPSPFSSRVEYFAANPEWGPGAYVNLSRRIDGGIIKDLHDRYLVLIRGNAQKGYDIVMQFVKAAGKTPSTQSLGLAMIRPLGDGKKSSFKITTRYQGQSYKVFGNISIGRSRVGFNIVNARNVQLDFARALRELKDTGDIRNN